MGIRRLRLLVYECESAEQMNKQIANSLQGKRTMNHQHGKEMVIQAIDLDLTRMTLLELWQLLKFEWQATHAEVSK